MVADRTQDELAAPDSAAGPRLSAELIAVLVAVSGASPRILTIEDEAALPSGPFESSDRSLQASLRAWVTQQTHQPLGYVEQLYTFADRDRGGQAIRAISISYLGLTREAVVSGRYEAAWQDWYRYFPWEDRRGEGGRGEGVGGESPQQDWIARHLAAWVAQAGGGERAGRRQRVDITFGLGGWTWNEELVLQRYELLYEAGLVAEAHRDRPAPDGLAPGAAMQHDHRRILATGMARLRAKIKWRPVVFELMPPQFTLLQLQQTMESLAGRRLHKQNFRRLIAQQELVEETGAMAAATGGRPAKLFRFRREVLLARAAGGSKLPLARAK
jgi:hypothetical protein